MIKKLCVLASLYMTKDCSLNAFLGPAQFDQVFVSNCMSIRCRSMYESTIYKDQISRC